MSSSRSSKAGSDDSLADSDRFSETSSKPKKNASKDFHLKLGQSFKSNDSSDDDSDKSLSRTSLSESTSARTPTTPAVKPRSFLKTDTKKSSHISVVDDDPDAFDARATMKKTANPRITSSREDEEADRKFAARFDQRPSRQSPDPFETMKRRDSKTSNKKSKMESSDSEGSTDRFPNEKHSSKKTDESDRSSRSRESNSRRQSLTDHDHEQTAKKILTKTFDQVSDRSHHEEKKSSSEKTRIVDDNQQHSSSRPSSAGHKLSDSKQNESTHEPRTTNFDQRTGTERRRTQSNIDAISSANNLDLTDSLRAKDEHLASELRPETSRPTSLSAKPPKPHTPRNNNKKKEQFKVPPAYRDITSKIDTGRGPISHEELQKSLDLRVKRQMEVLKKQRPRSASGRHTTRERSQSQERKRRPSAYDRVEPRVNSYLSINFDELNTSQSRADTSQSIKNDIYLEWAKYKDEQKKKEKQEEKKLKEYQTKNIDKSDIENKIRSEAAILEAWRQTKEREKREKLLEEKKREKERKAEENDKLQKKKEDAKFGFDKWKEEKDEKLKEKKREEEDAEKKRIEDLHSERLEKIRQSEEKVKEWQKKKEERQKKELEQTQTLRKSKIKEIHSSEEEKFKAAQKAYDDWLNKKENQEQSQSFNSSRRNSLSGRQERPQLPPFLPAGGSKNSGKVQHVAW